MSKPESEKGKKLEDLARAYGTAREELRQAQEAYDKLSRELEEEGIIPAQLKPKEDARTFEDFVKDDPDLYELTPEHAVFVLCGELVGKANLAAFLLERTGSYIIGGINTDAKTFDCANWRYNPVRKYKNPLPKKNKKESSEWFQEKLEIARRYNQMLDKKK